MADKYEGLLVTTVTNKPKYKKPWYKERVRTKYIKSMQKDEVNKLVVSKNWTFVRGGLDDFRSGLPPIENLQSDQVLIRGSKGLEPALVGQSRVSRTYPIASSGPSNASRAPEIGVLSAAESRQGASSRVSPATPIAHGRRSTADSFLMRPGTQSSSPSLQLAGNVLRPLDKNEKLFSRALPMKARKQARLEAIETALKQHPLPLHAHLEEAVQPEVFDDLVNLLDPEIYLAESANSQARQTSESQAKLAAARTSTSMSEKQQPAYQSAMERILQSQIGQTPEKTIASGVAEEDAAQTTSMVRFDERDDVGSSRAQSLAVGSEKQRPAEERLRAVSNMPVDDEAKDREEFRSNPYRWIVKRLEREAAEARLGRHETDDSESEYLEQSMNVAKDFAQWIESLGGTDNTHNVDPSTLVGLFASGYETKPALSVPINIVELHNVPPELRSSALLQNRHPVSASAPSAHNADASSKGTARGTGRAPTQRPPFKTGTGGPTLAPDEEVEFIKLRYGAWYLRMPRTFNVSTLVFFLFVL